MPLKPKYEEMRRKMVEQYGSEKGERIFYATISKLGLRDEIDLKSFVGPEFKALMKDGMVVGTKGILIDNQRDLLFDVCTRRSIKDMVAQLKSRPVTFDFEHEGFKRDGPYKYLAKVKNPLGKVTSCEYCEDGDYAYAEVETELNIKHPRYEEVSYAIKNEFLNGHSIAYLATDYAWLYSPDNKRTRYIDKLGVLNVTYTGVPVNPRARIGSTKVISMEAAA